MSSIFAYPDGLTATDYSHPDFVPIFIDAFDVNMTQKAEHICGGSSDQYKACIYDYLVTGDEEFATETKLTNTQNEEDRTSLGLYIDNTIINYMH